MICPTCGHEMPGPLDLTKLASKLGLTGHNQTVIRLLVQVYPGWLAGPSITREMYHGARKPIRPAHVLNVTAQRLNETLAKHGWVVERTHGSKNNPANFRLHSVQATIDKLR